MRKDEREAAALTQGTGEQIADPLFAKSPDDARWDTVEDAFSWGATNQVIGGQIWDRAREYERQSARPEPPEPESGSANVRESRG